jgi:hypothetical protein
MLIVKQIQPIHFSWGVSIWKALGEISSIFGSHLTYVNIFSWVVSIQKALGEISSVFGGHLTYLNLSPRKEKGSHTNSLSEV